jgi:hypothetical protein
MPYIRLFNIVVLAAFTFCLSDTAAAENEANGIVVTGRSLSDTGEDLKNCILRGCPPDEEIRVALAHAENQFITGEYRGAKSTLYQTVGRNRKFGSQYPIEVSDLFRARSRVAEHLGEPDDFRLAILDMRDILRDNLPADDARAMVAQIEVGESRAKLGYPKEAIRIFSNMEAKASTAGLNRIVTYASLRRLLIEYDMAQDTDAQGDIKRALAGLPKAGAEDFAMVAEVVLARMDRQLGLSESTDAIVKRFVEKGGAKRPILLAAEPINLPDSRNPKAQESLGAQIVGSGSGGKGAKLYGGNALRMLPGSFEDRWMDVGFWINPSGLVSDVEILRSSGDMYWAKWVSDSIRSRIYAPLSIKGREASPGFYMVERYTYISRYLPRDANTGTRVQSRSPQPRIERLDITPENYDQPFAPGTKPAG